MDFTFYEKIQGAQEKELLAYYFAIVTNVDIRKQGLNNLLKNVEDVSSEYCRSLAESVQDLKEKKGAVEKRFNEIYRFENRQDMKAWISIQYEILKEDASWKRMVKRKMKELSVK